MVDPVVASDGHSYERVAIMSVLRGQNKMSPLTREPLAHTVFANRTLLKRIRAYRDEMIECAETALAYALVQRLAASACIRLDAGHCATETRVACGMPDCSSTCSRLCAVFGHVFGRRSQHTG